MRHIRLVALLVALLPGLGGCNLFGGGEDTTVVENPTPVAVATGEAAPDPNAAPDGTAQAPANAPAAPAGMLPPELISSTNPAQRVQAVQRNRPDPFALIPTTPTVEISPGAVSQPVPQLPNLPNRSTPTNGGTAGGRGTTANRGTTGTTNNRPVANRPTVSQAPQTASRPGTLAPIPDLVPNNSIAAAPLPPQPTLAQAVKVTGVVQIGNTLHAIVSAPNEPSSRYVRVGQRLSNGQVLVKRIEVNRGSEPIVVLEQNGVEVQTAVGGGGADPTAAAGAVPPA